MKVILSKCNRKEADYDCRGSIAVPYTVRLLLLSLLPQGSVHCSCDQLKVNAFSL